MDTSEQFIRMCEKAYEIQGRELEEGGWCAWWLDTTHINTKVKSQYFSRVFCEEYPQSEGEFWLPRQDQLQEMVTDTIDCPSHSSFAIMINLGHRFNELAKDTDQFNYWAQFTSMEQLWLAFVMKERYGKGWRNNQWEALNGEWIKEE